MSIIISFFSKINWNYIWNIFLLFIGAGITYFLTVRREADKLRKDLQIKAADEVLSMTTKLREDVDIFINHNVAQVKLFELIYQAYEPEIDSVHMVVNNFFDKYKFDSIQSEFNIFLNKFNESVSNLKYKVQARRIVLEELWGDINFIYEKSENIASIAMEICTIFINCSQSGDMTREQMHKLIQDMKEINKIAIHISNSAHRFNIKLQNTYFSKLFNRSIPMNVDLQTVDILAESFLNNEADRIYSQMRQ